MKQFSLNKNKKNTVVSDRVKYNKLKDLLENSKMFIERNTLYNRTNKHIDKCANKSSVDLSKDFSLYLSLIEKPINLLFSIDQFVFEFSKKSYQQKKTGEFLQQLKERKKLCLFYGHLTRKQLVLLIDKVLKKKGLFSKNIFSLLERRLDVVLYRSGITKTVAEARQLIKHKKIQVNQNLVSIPSFSLNPGDIISTSPETVLVCSGRVLKGLNRKSKKKISSGKHKFFTKKQNQLLTSFPFVTRKLENSIDKPSHFFFYKKKTPFDKGGNGDTFFAFHDMKKDMCQIQPSIYGKIQLELFCQLLTRYICTRIQLSCKVTCLEMKNSNRFSPNRKRNGNKSTRPKASLGSIKNICIKLKRKFLQKNSVFSVLSNTGQQKNIYANIASLQKSPEFSSRNRLAVSLKNRFSRATRGFNKTIDPVVNWSQILALFFTGEGRGYWKTKSKPVNQAWTLNTKKTTHFNKKNLILFRNNFLSFFKYLEYHTQFTSLYTLNLKNFFFKNFLCKTNPVSIFDKNGKSYNLFKKFKPINLEISYSLLNVVYLYSPQRLNFPFYINLDVIQRSLR